MMSDLINQTAVSMSRARPGSVSRLSATPEKQGRSSPRMRGRRVIRSDPWGVGSRRGLTVTTNGAPDGGAEATRAITGGGHIGLIVVGSIGAGLVLGLLLVLGVFAGGDEPEIIGSALLALGGGFTLLAVVSARRTNQPQRWALIP